MCLPIAFGYASLVMYFGKNNNISFEGKLVYNNVICSDFLISYHRVYLQSGVDLTKCAYIKFAISIRYFEEITTCQVS